jgi:hypothetical protein
VARAVQLYHSVVVLVPEGCTHSQEKQNHRSHDWAAKCTPHMSALFCAAACREYDSGYGYGGDYAHMFPEHLKLELHVAPGGQSIGRQSVADKLATTPTTQYLE